MSFVEIYEQYKDVPLEDIRLGEQGRFAGLLSVGAEDRLEDLARQARKTTLRYFGRAIHLYTPIYLSNHCQNRCLYCGFNSDNEIERKKLTVDEVEREAQYISSTGLKHILVLTGDSPKENPVSYIKECVGVLRKYFDSVSIEIYALTAGEYRELIGCGVDGLTIYQEVYDADVYKKVHVSGAKKDYLFRLETPERALSEGMRFVNIGALLGLADWRKEIFFTGLHAGYLQDRYPEAEISISLPRLRPHAGSFSGECAVSDKNIVQAMAALRLFLPRAGITISTRESADFRENIIPLGVTRISAGSTTAVGGHTSSGVDKCNQFEIFDRRNVPEIMNMLRNKGYQPVMKDWMAI